MEILVRRFDPDLPLPAYHTDGAAGLDLSARLGVEIAPGAVASVPLNLAIQAPDGYWTMLAARSSLHKRGLMLANGVGVMDPDFCGNEDEYRAVLYNFGRETARVERGERIVQLLFLPSCQVRVRAVECLDGPSRGGFGTTSDL